MPSVEINTTPVLYSIDIRTGSGRGDFDRGAGGVAYIESAAVPNIGDMVEVTGYGPRPERAPLWIRYRVIDRMWDLTGGGENPLVTLIVSEVQSGGGR